MGLPIVFSTLGSTGELSFPQQEQKNPLQGGWSTSPQAGQATRSSWQSLELVVALPLLSTKRYIQCGHSISSVS